MEILFLGVGEACDENFPNTSILIYDKNCALLDCGFSVPHNFFKFIKDPDQLDLIWISHFHGDHYFGVPLMILRFWETGRTKPLYIAGQKGIKEKVETAMELAYPSFLKKLKYELIFIELSPLEPTSILGFRLRGTFSNHSQKNMVLRIDGTKSVYYSGDGKPTYECIQLAKGTDLIIHECFMIDQEVEGHGNVKLSVDFASSSGVNKLAIVHMQRDERKKFKIDLIETKGVDVLIPLPGEKIVL